MIAAVDGTVWQEADHAAQSRIHYDLCIDEVGRDARGDFPFFARDDIVIIPGGFPHTNTSGVSTRLCRGQSFREINRDLPHC